VILFTIITGFGAGWPTANPRKASPKQKPHSSGSIPINLCPKMKNLIIILLLWLSAFAAAAQSKKDKRVDTADNKPAPTSTMFKMRYDDLFSQNADATWSPKQPLMINGEMVGTDTKLAIGVRYGGIDLLGSSGHDMLVDTARGVVIIRQVVK